MGSAMNKCNKDVNDGICTDECNENINNSDYPYPSRCCIATENTAMLLLLLSIEKTNI